VTDAPPPAQATELVLDGAVRARAGVNFALIKYWGKAPARGPLDANLPAVPSLSLTLEDPWTEVTVRLAPEQPADTMVVDGVPLDEGGMRRVVAVLDRVRELADLAAPFAATSVSRVPMAAGLASSASSMAALAAAASRCAGLGPGTDRATSEIARLGSGSASRSVFGGWVTWEGRAAEPLAPPDHMDVAMVIAMVDAGRKAISSREAMNRTAATSPLYEGWVRQARGTFDEAVEAVRARDLSGLIAAMEASTYRMHASAMGARPPILYWRPASLEVVRAVEGLRGEGLTVGWTMDAGPNVKVLCRADDADSVAERVASIDGVSRMLVSRPGAGVSVRLVSEQP